MSLFFAFVILINAAAMIAVGYLVWNVGEIFDRKLTETIRKQDDRLRKRHQGALNGQQAESQEASAEQASQPGQQQANQTAIAKPRHQAGRPYRR